MKTAAAFFKYSAILWLCLFSIIDLKAFPDRVLCIGQDGHIEFEMAVDGGCGNGARSAIPDGLNLLPDAGDHCGDCSDVLLFSDSSHGKLLRGLATTSVDLHSFGTTSAAWFQPLQAHVGTGIRRIVPPRTPHDLASILSVRILV